MSELKKKEFSFTLKNKVSYHHKGQEIFTDKITLKVLSKKTRHIANGLKQCFFRAMKSMQNSEAAERQSKTLATDKNPIELLDGPAVCMALMMSDIDINIPLGHFKAILHKCAYLDDEGKFSDISYSEIDPDDVEILMGEYVANFLIPSWVAKAMKS
jgi:hypothetical protein